jgi:ABC-type antimicrobial peptide transport system permease subunit
MALGADSYAIAALTYRSGLTVIASGLVVGCFGALAARHYLANQLYATNFSDGLTWAAVLAVISCTGIIACAVPARRAAKLDPVYSLRSD